MSSTIPLLPFSCTYTPNIPHLLADLNCSLIVSTYQADKVIIISAIGEQLIQLPRAFNTPLGIALDGKKMAIATKDEVVVLANAPGLAWSYPNKPHYYDAMFVPRSIYFCGETAVHDLVWIDDELIGVNTSFSCLCRFSHDYSFVPFWTPSFIDALVPEDRCHLNGLAVVDGVPRYVTALGDSNSEEGWREKKLDGGVLMEVETGEILLRNLPAPHSPRMFRGELYILLSATGELAVVDLDKGSYEVMDKMPGFVRGMACQGDYAFVSVSKLRKMQVDDGEDFCGLMVYHLPSGSRVGQMKYESSCDEIYDVQILAGMKTPGILRADQPAHRLALSIPENTFWKMEEE